VVAMAKGKTKQKADVVKHTKAKQTQVYEDGEAPGALAAPRSSRFKEGTMNSTLSIHAPPDKLWKGLDIEKMINGFNEENSAPVSATGVVLHAHARSRSTPYAQNVSVVPAVPATPTTPAAPASDGPFGRLWRPISTFFNGAGASFSALGKRKAGSENAENKAIEKGGVATEKTLDKSSYDTKEDVEAAYHQAKEQGLMPTPKVFIRPVSRARKNGTLHPRSVPEGIHADQYTLAPTTTPETPSTSFSSLAPPKTPTLYKSPSKKDLHKQKKLSKRVSELELKLASARKELSAVLASPSAPPLPSIPANLPSPPTSTHFFSEAETSPHSHADLPSDPKPTSPSSKIVKKRKATTDADDEYKPVTTDSDISHDSERESKRSKSTPSQKLRRKPSSRLLKKRSSITKENVVIMVPDGVDVPPLPALPSGVNGKKVLVRNDDGYGGFGDEMF
jgi:hypothetical protein